jgi:transcription-repair coupling factor (superfamily II helicase)
MSAPITNQYSHGKPGNTEKQIRGVEAILRQAWPGQAPAVAAPALPGAAAALTALALNRHHSQTWVVVVAAGPNELEALYADLRTLAPPGSHEPLLLPPPEAGDKSDIELDGARLAVAHCLQGEASQPLATLLVTTATALLAPLPDPAAVAEAGRTLRVGSEDHPFDQLVAALVQAGYAREPEVIAKGQLAVRGGLIDLWPPDAPLPIRVDFFGNVIESLRTFDPASQRSLERLETVWAPPCASANLAAIAPVERIPLGSVMLWLDHDRLASMTSFPGAETPSLDAWAQLQTAVLKREPARQIFCGEPAPPRTPSLPISVAAAPGLADLADDPDQPDLRATARQKLLAGLETRARAGEEVVIHLDTAGGVEWLTRELPADTAIVLRHGVLSGGCEWPALKLVLLGQPDIYAIRKRSGRKFVPPAIANQGGRVERSEEIRPGELVVHIDHGIGRFEGTSEIERDGHRIEVMTIRYADGARLHVPTSHAHLLSRYIGIGGREVPLHRLGGRRWQQDKIKAERAIVDFAASLLEVQARRNARPGIAYDVSPPWMHAFDAAFPFVETPDQTRCIEAVKHDLAEPRPMDRLICGDAGYGKTEVAMRAAFAVVMNGRQVAVLCPTTVLAEQHYETFRERMAAFPVRIEVLSRFRSIGRREATLADLAIGKVDILIGTHALIQPRVAFKDLGLVVIDEEQRFGVVHKERLKQVRATVDVLTLSATPIPRTLYMSMTGARDMSLLQTPPQERLAIETRVERDDDAVIRTAVLNEIAREGQVYFLHNRVMTIDLMRRRLERLLPEARIAVAHGQQTSAMLSTTMHRFGQGEFDVLLCTTIIESGLDIPRANTIIIHRADRFGLADLYQLRGRVGRSSKRGFAYLLLPPQGLMDEEARQRIGALQRHGGLGGGLHLALRDLEIRGAGNMLGAEQSGHISAVGFGLYCQLLRRTVARLQGKNPPPLIDVELELDFIKLSPGITDADSSACLPYGYIEDETQRVRTHRQLAEAVTVAEVRAIRESLLDRYGKAPQEVTRLLRLTELRIVATTRGIIRVETRAEVVYLIQRDRQPVTGAGGLLPRLRGKTPDQKLTALFRLMASLPQGGKGLTARG